MKRLIATLLLAAKVRPSFGFAVRQLRGEPGVNSYELRASGRRIFVRHDTDDAYVLAECFGRLRAYEPPPEVEALLSRQAPRRVLDLGANIGLFGLLALERWPGCEVTGIEADPANAELHRRCIEENGLAERWRLIEAVAATAPGRVRFAGGHSSRSRQAGPGDPDAIEVEAIDAFEHLEAADLVKIDIEGGEWVLLTDPRLAGVGATTIVLEYHSTGSLQEDASLVAASALEEAGYKTAVIPAPASRAGDSQQGLGTVWAWRARGADVGRE